jgi:hypothetical protein
MRQKVKKYWPLVAGALLVLAVFGWINGRADRILKQSNDKLRIQTERANQLRVEIARGEATIETANQDKAALKRRYSELEERLRNMPQPKPIERIKTVTVEREVYVPKIEYTTLWNHCQISDAMRLDYASYLHVDDTATSALGRVLRDHKALDNTHQETIADLITVRDKLASIANRKWGLVVGPSVVTSINGTISWGFGVTLGYRIF